MIDTAKSQVPCPCPFCGTKEVSEEGLRIRLNWVECQVCCTYGPRPEEGETAVDAWNRRAAQAAAPKEAA